MADILNPQAFPGASVLQSGMTLRDWFAGQALPQSINIVRNGSRNRPEASLDDLKKCAALIAYDFADAMLAARPNKETDQ